MPNELEVAGTQLADDGEHIPAGIREEREQERKTPSEKDAASAAASETAAASEAADTQRQQEERQQQQEEQRRKTAGTSESRWAKLSRENRELREKLARSEGRAEGSQSAQQRETQQGSQPAADAKTSATAKPKIDDVDPKTNQPKYKSYADYEEAKDAWNRQEAIREFQQTSEKSAQERQQTEAEQIINQTVTERVAEVRKIHADYDDTIKTALAQKDEHGREIFFYTKGSPIDGFFLDCDRGHEVMYEIGKNFEQHQHIFARDAQGKYLLNPVRQLRELAKIENALPEKASSSGTSQADSAARTAASSSSARPVTQAPRPPHQVSGKGTVNKDAVEDAAEKGDFETYMREQNARVLAKLQRK